MPKIDFLDIVFPKSCLGCGKSCSYICDFCIAKEITFEQVCPHCGRAAIDGMTHSKCLRKLGLDGQISLWGYSGVARKAILALKYKLAREVAKELARRAVENINKRRLVFPKNPVLIPIPLYWYRGNVRGFNQSEEIGKLIAKDLGWEFAPDLIIRTASTVP